MAFRLANRVKMTVSGTPGTGSITLGTSITGYVSFATGGIVDGDTVSYVVEDIGGAWEIGVGTYTATGTILARTTVTASSAGGTTKISVTSAGIVFIAPLAADLQSTNTLTSGTLSSVRGGTGQSAYTIGDLLYASTTTALSKLADVATGNALISGGVGVAPSWGKIGLTTHVSGTLPVANGGTAAADAANARINLGAPQRGSFATNPESSIAAADVRNLTNPSTGVGYGDGLRVRFSSLNDDSTTPYADVIDLSTYTDSSGGGYNALYLGKNSQLIQHKWAAAGGTSWTVKTLAYVSGDIGTPTAGVLTNCTGYDYKNIVDSPYKNGVAVATTADLAASLYSNGTSGVGATLTGYSSTASLAVTTTATSTTATTTSTAGIKVGSVISGNANIPASTTVASITNATTFVMSAAATTAGTSVTTTFTNTIAALTVDGYTLALNDRVLVKDQSTLGGIADTANSKNGIYYLSTLGSTTVAWVLTRATGCDTASEMAGAVVTVDRGTANAAKLYTNNFPSTGTIGTTANVWAEIPAGTVTAIQGGTGQTSYAVGDLLYASTTTALSKLADVATGNALISGGVGVAPSWGKIGLTTHVSGTLAETNGGTGQATYAIGDLLYGDAANSLGKLAAVATGNALISGGVTTAPSWGKVGLTTHVSGTLPVANGGTGATTLTGLVKGSGTSAFTAATAGTDYMSPSTTSSITIGYTFTSYNLGTGSGTVTPNPALKNYQYITNNGAFTLAAPSSDCAIDILVTNGTTAGAITMSGFTAPTTSGDTYATTNANKYLLMIRRINAISTYAWKALQ